MKMRPVTLAVLLGFSVTSPVIFAADTATTKKMSPDATPATPHPATAVAPAPSVKANRDAYRADKDQLKNALGTGHDKAFYRQELEKMGYAITAVNSDKKDYLEYEVVKAGKSYEVQVDFKNGNSTKVDIDNNV